MVERGLLPGVTRIGRRVLVRSADLLDFLDHNRAPSPQETGDERDNQTVSTGWLGGGYPTPAAERPTVPGTWQGARDVQVGGPAMGRGP